MENNSLQQPDIFTFQGFHFLLLNQKYPRKRDSIFVPLPVLPRSNFLWGEKKGCDERLF